ncbi:MAG: hypothetical protein SO238_11000 [Treponema sp.]|nr:hypothetical protein [Treponema sp.]MDY2824265.1 hypothetical protein [Treponema sp.]MDY4768942.1 hypothetical protein [Treponema sp.]MEE1268076.1 hypothetical protein [Treponema sp.]
MEEFRSTEILDKEIQADARKKAEKILAKADVDCALLLEEVSGRIEKAKKELEDKYSLKIAAFEKDLSATLPLEKERFLVSFIQSSIEKAINAYLAKLSDEEKIDLVLKKSVKIEDVLKSKKLNALYYGFQESLVKKTVGKKFNLISVKETEFNKMIIENDLGITDRKGIILESEDKAIRVRMTLSEVISQIQDKYRAELYSALFGERLNTVAGGSK